MTVKTGDRIPPEDLEAIIARALDGLDFEHDSSWLRPESCPCHDHGLSCLVPMPAEHGRCQGHVIEVPTPPEHVVNLAILTAALPEPGSDGTLEAHQAALSILGVIEARLSYPYSLRASHLVKRLTEEAEEYELAHGGAVPAASPSPGYALKCQWCSGVIPSERGPKARYCRNSHRVSAHKAKKRQQERQANEAPAGQPLTVSPAGR